MQDDLRLVNERTPAAAFLTLGQLFEQVGAEGVFRLRKGRHVDIARQAQLPMLRIAHEQVHAFGLEGLGQRGDEAVRILDTEAEVAAGK